MLQCIFPKNRGIFLTQPQDQLSAPSHFVVMRKLRPRPAEKMLHMFGAHGPALPWFPPSPGTLPSPLCSHILIRLPSPVPAPCPPENLPFHSSLSDSRTFPLGTINSTHHRALRAMLQLLLQACTVYFFLFTWTSLCQSNFSLQKAKVHASFYTVFLSVSLNTW